MGLDLLSFMRPVRQHFNRRLSFCVCMLMCCSANFAFDNKAFSQTQAMPQFTRRFGDYNRATGKYKLEATYLALFNSLNFAGFAIGLWIGTSLQARIGRKKVVGIMMIVPVVAATILVTSKERWQLFAGRQLFYIFAGIDLGLIPVYQAELVPTEVRGFAVGTYQLSYGWGALIMNFITRGTSEIKGDLAWKLPYCVFYIIPVMIWCVWYWLPESPRWLISKGRVQEAKDVLRTLRVDNSEEALDREIAAVLAVVNNKAEQGKWKDMLKGTNFRRMTINVGCIFFNQMTGQSFANKYGAVFVAMIGSVNPQDMGIVNGVAGVLSTLLAMFYTDRIGRRTIFLTGACIQSVALLVMGGVSCLSPMTWAGGVVVSSMLPVYGLGYGFGSSSVNHVLTAEIPHQSLRDKTSRLVGWNNNLWGFLVSFTLPYLMDTAGLQGKVGFIFAFFSLLSLLYGYFWLPECAGRSLEEINLMFYEKVSARDSVKWKPPADWLEQLEKYTAKGSTGSKLDEEEDIGEKVLDGESGEKGIDKATVQHLEVAHQKQAELKNSGVA